VVTVAAPKPKTAAPALKTTGTAWPALLASLSGHGQRVLANPDPSKLADVAQPGCAMYNLLSRQTILLFSVLLGALRDIRWMALTLITAGAAGWVVLQVRAWALWLPLTLKAVLLEDEN
jgi:hypothetical protein